MVSTPALKHSVLPSRPDKPCFRRPGRGPRLDYRRRRLLLRLQARIRSVSAMGPQIGSLRRPRAVTGAHRRVAWTAD